MHDTNWQDNYYQKFTHFKNNPCPVVHPNTLHLYLNKLDIIFKNFIWKGKTAKFRKEITGNPIQKGGLGLINLEIFDRALKLSWLKRIHQQTNGCHS